jgi:ribonuclease Z
MSVRIYLYVYKHAHTHSTTVHPPSAAVTAALTHMRAVRVECVKVIHIKHAYAVIVSLDLLGSTHPPWRVCVSGDTRPCDRLVDAGQGCDVLVHEATFDSELGQACV